MFPPKKFILTISPYTRNFFWIIASGFSSYPVTHNFFILFQNLEYFPLFHSILKNSREIWFLVWDGYRDAIVSGFTSYTIWVQEEREKLISRIILQNFWSSQKGKYFMKLCLKFKSKKFVLNSLQFLSFFHSNFVETLWRKWWLTYISSLVVYINVVDLVLRGFHKKETQNRVVEICMFIPSPFHCSWFITSRQKAWLPTERLVKI